MKQEKEDCDVDLCQWKNCSGGRFCKKHSLEVEPKENHGNN